MKIIMHFYKQSSKKKERTLMLSKYETLNTCLKLQVHTFLERDTHEDCT